MSRSSVPKNENGFSSKFGYQICSKFWYIQVPKTGTDLVPNLGTYTGTKIWNQIRYRFGYLDRYQTLKPNPFPFLAPQIARWVSCAALSTVVWSGLRCPKYGGSGWLAPP